MQAKNVIINIRNSYSKIRNEGILSITDIFVFVSIRSLQLIISGTRDYRKMRLFTRMKCNISAGWWAVDSKQFGQCYWFGLYFGYCRLRSPGSWAESPEYQTSCQGSRRLFEAFTLVPISDDEFGEGGSRWAAAAILNNANHLALGSKGYFTFEAFESVT